MLIQHSNSSSFSSDRELQNMVDFQPYLGVENYKLKFLVHNGTRKHQYLKLYTN